MDWCTILELCFAGYLLLQLLRLAVSDCDLQLQWAEKFGKSTGVLSRKVVWVTGASSGIGEYLAYKLAKAGSRLVLTARREEELQRVKKECLTYGTLMDDDILVLPLDLTKTELHTPATQEVLARFSQIDILVNNAGRYQRGLFLDTDLAVDRAVLELNVLSVLSLTKCVLPHMIERQSGQIIVTNSMAGRLATPGDTAYSGSKHALHGWFDGVRSELYHKNITVTSICPGPVHSNIHQGSLTESLNKPVGIPKTVFDKRMSTSRCARLMAVTLANKLDEVWICEQPILMAIYIRQYLPSLYNWVMNRYGMQRFEKMKQKKSST